MREDAERSLESLFEEFLEEKKYLANCVPGTILFFRRSWKVYVKIKGSSGGVPTQGDLNNFIIRLRQEGKTVGCINSYIRRMRSFLRWMISRQYADPSLRLLELKGERKVLLGLKDEEPEAIIRYRPKTFAQRRIHTLALALMDTGCRIAEMLSLTREAIDLDNLLIKVRGRGKRIGSFRSAWS